MRNLPRLFATLALAALAACTKPNPASCLDGTCSDPSLPYCDADGALEGTPGQCIAVTCDANEFVTCNGDSQVTCNAQGTNYVTTVCPLGCDATTGGCRSCEPNETACTNGKVATCDANGAVTSSTECALGCFEDEPRCRELDPSNGLAQYADGVANPPDIDVTDYTFDTGSGTLLADNGSGSPPSAVEIPSVLVTTVTPPVRIFVVRSLHLRGTGRSFSSADPLYYLTGPAIAFFSTADVTIEGTFSIPGATGGISSATCMSGPGNEGGTQASFMRFVLQASGGGGNATAGAMGGIVVGIPETQTPAAAGTVIGTASIVPLMGGCASGGFIGDEFPRPPPFGGGQGGGALQISSRTRISIDGVIRAIGGTGEIEQSRHGGTTYGGGAGGSILLEAPTIELTANARLNVKGGAGGSVCGYPPDGFDDLAPNPASTCGTQASAAGGAGAAPGSAAVNGNNATYSQTGEFYASGGGGGGLGRIRYNTKTGTYVKSSAAIEAGAVTAGIAATR